VYSMGLVGITVDAAGTGYVTGANVHAVHVIENIGSRSGTITPDRVITGPATGLSSPGRMVAVTR
jgi:hypothetical protein